MSTICLIDTSIFVEILNIPGKSNKHNEIVDELEKKIDSNESLFLPMATIFETGNHISQCKQKNGEIRRRCAERFIEQVSKALQGESPFQPIYFVKQNEMLSWLKEFPDSAMRGIGFGDISIIQDWKRLRNQNKRATVYIWSLDQHLKSYSHTT